MDEVIAKKRGRPRKVKVEKPKNPAGRPGGTKKTRATVKRIVNKLLEEEAAEVYDYIKANMLEKMRNREDIEKIMLDYENCKKTAHIKV